MDVNHFTLHELFANCSQSEIFQAITRRDVSKNLTLWMTILNNMRDKIGIPIKVNSCFRDTLHNNRVGGSPTSHHLCAQAVDIKCSNNVDLYRVICQYSHLFGQCLCYVDTGKANEIGNIRFFHLSLTDSSNPFRMNYRKYSPKT